MPTKEEIQGAFTAWALAVKEKLYKNDPMVSIEELAKSHGGVKHCHTSLVTSHEALDVVEEWFNWGSITDYINSN